MQRLATFVFVTLTCSLAARAAHAQTEGTGTTEPASTPPANPADAARVEEARNQYRDGVTAFRARHYGDAVVAFERSNRLRPHPVTLYNAAEAWLRAGDRDRAIDELRQLLAFTSPPPDAALVERARALAREAGVNDLQPAEAPRAPTCPACPTCPPQRECPILPPVQGSASHGPLPHILAGAGIAVFAIGLGFYGNALGDAYSYAQLDPATTNQAVFDSIRSQGEVFRVVGLIGILAGLGSAGTSVYFYLNPTRQAAPTPSQPSPPSNAPTARVDFGPGSLLVSGTF